MDPFGSGFSFEQISAFVRQVNKCFRLFSVFHTVFSLAPLSLPRLISTVDIPVGPGSATATASDASYCKVFRLIRIFSISEVPSISLVSLPFVYDWL